MLKVKSKKEVSQMCLCFKSYILCQPCLLYWQCRCIFVCVLIFVCIFVFDCAYAFCIWCILWHVSGGNIGWVCKGCQIKVFKSLLHFLTHGISMRGTFILKQLWRTTCIANTAIVQWSKHLWKYVFDWRLLKYQNAPSKDRTVQFG